jgi:hypothetical protein
MDRCSLLGLLSSIWAFRSSSHPLIAKVISLIELRCHGVDFYCQQVLTRNLDGSTGRWVVAKTKSQRAGFASLDFGKQTQRSFILVHRRSSPCFPFSTFFSPPTRNTRLLTKSLCRLRESAIISSLFTDLLSVLVPIHWRFTEWWVACQSINRVR